MVTNATSPTPSGRYVVISADCHAGADLRDYRPFLEARHLDEFDAWADSYVSPYGDLVKPDADRNWDSTRRMRDLEADGVVAEVLYPNTVPPFFPKGGLTSLAPSPNEFALRLAGLRAHNRWLAAWCAEFPEQRAGIGQILLNDIDEAIADVHWIADHGLRGGVLLPGIPPGAPLPPMHAPVYDPVWQACAERGVVVNAHAGSHSPDYGEHPASLSMWLMETSWFSHRPLWTFIMSGVFDRFPALRLVLAEQGSGWIRQALMTMDGFYAQIAAGNVGELRFQQPQLLERMPSEYWESNCAVAASFLHRDDCRRREGIGVDKIMWGSDYPHLEGTAPFSEEAIRMTFADVPTEEVAAMLGANAARVYGFDLDALAPLAAACGPEVAAVAAGLDRVPEGARSMAFRQTVISNV
ncbi:MAG: amidohydrolase family protein [Acidimicrobiia bacterium]|jgi:predicted TIM-barrel fold metal-dependent hydrolase